MTSLDTARNFSPSEYVWDGVLVPYLENKSVGGCWISGMGGIPIPKGRVRNWELGAVQDFSSRSPVAGELGQSLLSSHISVLLTLQSSSWSWK